MLFYSDNEKIKNTSSPAGIIVSIFVKKTMGNMDKYNAETLFALARYGIESELLNSEPLLPLLDDHYHLKRACFVTLTLGGQLRGCIGSLVPHQSLKEDVISNAHNAAFKDHRFSPLTESEYQQVKISVSVLTVPQPVLFEDKAELQRSIRPGRDGIVLTCHGRSSTFLPHVWEELPDFDTFFSALFQKAGLGNQADFENCSIYSYQVEKYDEG